MTGEPATPAPAGTEIPKITFWQGVGNFLSGGGFGKTYQAAQLDTQNKQQETDDKTLYLLLFFILLMFGGTAAFFILKK